MTGRTGEGKPYPRRVTGSRKPMRPNADVVRQAAHALAAAPSRDQLLARWGLAFDEVRAAGLGLHKGALLIPFRGPDGALLGAKLRDLGKGHDDPGRFKWLGPGRAPWLYAPPASLDGDQVMLAEGPLKALALSVIMRRPVAALASGAGVGIPERGRELLRGKHVLYVGDPDAEGVAAHDLIARQLRGIAASLRVISFPPAGWTLDGQPVGDVNDAVAGLRRVYGERAADALAEAKARIEQLLAEAPDLLARGNGKAGPAGPAAADEKVAERLVGMFHRTDLGNAARLVAEHHADLRYCDSWVKWLVWDGCRWAPDEVREIHRRAERVVVGILREASALADPTQRAALAKHALASQAASRIAAMVALARNHERVVVTPKDLDQNAWLLNVENGTLDLRTGTLRRHRREDYITKLALVKYDPEARAPTWEAFLHSIFPEKPTVIRFVQKAVGYSLTGDIREHVLFFLYGPGANGKTTLLLVLKVLLGDYARQAPPDLLTLKRGIEHPTGLADLAGARLVACTEAEEGRRLAEALVKQMTGGDRMKARRMREDFWEFQPEHKTWLAANHKPRIRGTDHAIWRRIRLIPFSVTFHPPDSDEEPKQDRDLLEKLRGELPGILRWAVEGCLAWQREGLGAPEEVKAATEEYRRESDLVGAFIQERCIVEPSEWARAKDLFGEYLGWCKQNNEDPLSQREFGEKLSERGFARKRSGVHTWRGIGLRPQGSEALLPDEEADAVPF